MYFTPVPEGVRHLSIHWHCEQRNTSLKSLVCNTVVQKRGSWEKKEKKKKSKLRLDPEA